LDIAVSILKILENMRNIWRISGSRWVNIKKQADLL
jgi:hypothetical protein